MNTAEKPAMNKSALAMMAFLNLDRSVGSVSCSTDNPVMYEIYEGTSGSTQGDTNESKPAENAAITEICGRDCIMRLRLHQELNQLMRLRRAPVACPEDLLPDDPVTVHHERHRQRARTIGQPHSKIGIVQNRKRQADFSLKRTGHRGALRISGHSENLKILPRKCVVELLHRWHFNAAGPAPCRPKIHQDNLPKEIRQRDNFSIEIPQLKIRRRVAGFYETPLRGRIPHILVEEQQRPVCS